MHNENLEMAIESLAEEIEGIESYKEMIDKSTCPELKKIFYDNMQAEKKHVTTLLAWINAEAHRSLK